MKKTRICIVTATRAEYGLLYWLLKDFQGAEDFEVDLVVTGMHLSAQYGYTYRDIEADGFNIHHKIEMLLSSDTPTGMSKSIGLGLIGFADLLCASSYDFVLVLGDRYELLAIVQAALMAVIPVIHLSGGELTEGVIDDCIRHAITKMSHLHFVTNERYRQRVIQMGEHPERVYTVGEPGLEHLRRSTLLSKSELEVVLDFPIRGSLFLVTYHPETLNGDSVEAACDALFQALSSFENASIIISYPNADASGNLIITAIDSFAAVRKGRVYVTKSLGHINYLSALSLADVVIGNSSSGLVEAPSFETPTVNVGDRQKGRLKAISVIDVKADAKPIVNAISRALSEEFKAAIVDVENPYGDGHTTEKVITALRTVDPATLIPKSFYDLETL
ncbi:MAG: UDP-N-acetylglucosamine 2-epimerase (hydrolyzing) [Pseudomonadales bacterium]|nr:UDP-N-acetylglucosamine 2-epimerase (hydrolyzing) [Pseudomonadales bacterium]